MAIVLCPDARKAWEAAGSQILHFGIRILAIRLKITSDNGQEDKIFLVSAYAPIGAAKSAIREEYERNMQQCIAACGKHEFLVIGADTNSSVGTRDKFDDPFSPGRDQVRGIFGMPHQNKAGRELTDLLGINELCLPSTYFRKKTYGTWTNPCNKLSHQLDHFIVRQKDLKRVVDAGRYGALGKDSDHCPIRMLIKVGVRRKKETKSRTRIDRGLLKDPEVAESFIGAVKLAYNADHGNASALLRLEGALQTAAKEVLTTEARKQPGWFEAAKDRLVPAIAARNEAQAANVANPTKHLALVLKAARKVVKREVRIAENNWLSCLVEIINGKELRDPKAIWTAIKQIRNGKAVTQELHPMKLKKQDGSLCETPEENIEVMAANLNSTFNKTGQFDPEVIKLVRQRDPTPFAWMRNKPADSEYTAAIKRLQNDKSGADAKIPAEYYKVLEKDPETRTYIRTLIDNFWTTGSYQGELTVPPPTPTPPHISPPPTLQTLYSTINAQARDWKNPKAAPAWDATADKDGVMFEEWQVARLKLLPKKGDLSLCKNWRGICLLDVASKIVSTIINARMSIVQETHGIEPQTGFRGNRGTIDGLFTAYIGLQKRKEHGLATWVLFIDLVKAFDTVIREVAFAVLRKFGFPDHFIHIVIRLHSNASVKFKVGDVDTTVPSSIGVRQGSVEGPSIFLFVMQAAIETMEWPVAKPEFCTRDDGKTHGERWDRKTQGERWENRKIETFPLWSSLFADDCKVSFNSREDLIVGTNYLYNHLLRFGLLMHVGHGSEASKTEAMYCPCKGDVYAEGDTSDFKVAGDGFISFTEKFKYLGSMISYSLTSSTDVDKCIAKAGAAFGALRKDVFSNKHVKDRIKGKCYNAFVLSTLLHGSECWSMTEPLLNRLRAFHNKCARVMCRITMHHTIKHHIRSTTLHTKLNIQSLDHYYHSRLLRWAGHVARMDMKRLPRKLLTGWVAHPRPKGRPLMNFGHTLKKALLVKGLPADFSEWRKIAANLIIYGKFD